MAPTDTPAARETACRILDEVNRIHRTRFRPVRPLTGGFQSETWLLSAPPNHTRAVLKWSPDPGRARQVLRAHRAVATVRAAGYATPEWLAAGVTAAGLPYHVQRFIPGAPPAPGLTDATARLLIPLVESQRGLDADPGHCWSRYVRDSLADGGWAIRERLAATGLAGRGFATEVGALLGAYGEAELPSGDLVHGDLRPANTVVDAEGRPWAVDAEALGSGTRAYDYATLLTEDEADPSAWDLTRAAGERVAGPAVLAHCFALAALELADFVRSRRPDRLPALLGPLTARAVRLRP
ncbi:phosphotransferase family protein [Streptomyces sp. NBC_00859]|uniref:phosphotransferase family protein n=1 Tax=Streptomyces sp. NBC_00859 TaxID=2903682 RepID=UPI00386F87BD|nr:aminoglycoside phosphotransferase family protein [Streptomyces sp. NBC_00859]